MSTTTINFTMKDLDGTVVPLTDFIISSGRLNTGEIPDVLPADLEFTTDDDGQATVELEVTEAPYYISKQDGTTDTFISYKFFVPFSATPLNAEMLYVDLGKLSEGWNDKSVAALIEAKVVAVNARNQALQLAMVLGTIEDIQDTFDSVTLVEENINDIVTVSDNIASVTLVADSIDNVDTIAPHTDSIDYVAQHLHNVHIVEDAANIVESLGESDGSTFVGYEGSTVGAALDIVKNTLTSYSYFINAKNNSIANCAINGATDDSSALQAIADYIKANNLRGVRLYLPYTGQPIRLHTPVIFSVGYVLLDIQCDMKFTRTSYAAGSTPIYFRPLTPAEVPLRNVGVIGQNIQIDGNARNFTDLPADGYDSISRSDCLHIFAAENVYVAGIHAYNGIGFGININFCRRALVDNCEASYNLRENGIAVNFFPYWHLPRDPETNAPIYADYDSEDPEWWCQSLVRNSRAHHNTDVGISTYAANGVYHQNCLTWENGNEGGFYNAGGGFSAEGNHPDVEGKNLYIFYDGCRSFNEKNYNFYYDTTVQARYRDCHADGVVSTPLVGGNPIRRAANWKGMTGRGATANLIDCSARNSDDLTLLLLGDESATLKEVNFIATNSDFVEADKQGVYGYLVGKFYLNGGSWEDIGGGVGSPSNNLFQLTRPASPLVYQTDLSIKGTRFKNVGYSSLNYCKNVRLEFDYYSSGAYMREQSYADGFAVYFSDVAVAKNITSVYTPTGAETFTPVRFYSSVQTGIMSGNDATPRLPINGAVSRPTERASTTANRPTGSVLFDGFQWYDTTLDKPIWWNGSAWKDGTGTTV